MLVSCSTDIIYNYLDTVISWVFMWISNPLLYFFRQLTFFAWFISFLSTGQLTDCKVISVQAFIVCYV